MRCHLSWIRFAAIAAVLAGSTQIGAQVAPYRPLPQYPSTTPVATTPVVGAQQPYAASQQQYAVPQQTHTANQSVLPQQSVVPQQTAGALPTLPPRQTTAQPTIAPQQTAATPYRAPGATPYPRVATAYPRVATAYPQVTPSTAASSQTSPSYAASGYPQTVAPYSPGGYPPAAPYSPTGYPQTASATSAAGYPQTADRYSPYYSTVAQESESIPAPDPAASNSIPAPSANGLDPNAAPPLEEGTTASPASGVTNGAANGYETNGMPRPNGSALPPLNGYHGYPTTSPTSAECSESETDYGLRGYFDNPHHDAQWFGGIYWLFMNRDDAEFRRLAAQFDTPAGGYPYYPTADTTALSTVNADHDYRSGGEIRFGSSFAVGGGDSCHSSCGSPYGYGYGCNSCNVQSYAWEVGYWILDDDINTAQVIDSIPTDTDRIYGMMNFGGLEYNGRPVNDYYDYQVPVTDPTLAGATDVRLLAQRVRSNFRAQNLELNFFRLPVCGVGNCGGTAIGGFGGTDCTPACGSPFSVTTLCGIRYVRIDDDFEYATMWAIDDGAGTLTPPAYTPWDGANELYYDVNVDNQLVGFQLGANMNYCISCKCNVFWNTNFGLYNNHINVHQRVYGELGPANWAGSGENAVVYANKDDVAFVGEMLIGTSYDFTCNWRGILAYRAVALSGVALSVDQMPQDFSNEAQVALVDSNGSLVVHGVQLGVECRY